MKKLALLLLLLLGTSVAKAESNPSNDAPDYWKDLYSHNRAPEWFQDAKLGIYFHWGVYSVPAHDGEWYPRWMYYKGSPDNLYHEKTYGKVEDFGYHDFIPMFKAENFDAKEWADLFKKAGARFAGPVAEHHDGFSMWDSEITPWNAKDMGPKRDIVGELEKAIKSEKMKFITTFHHARNLQRYSTDPQKELDRKTKETNKFNNSHYPYYKGLDPTSTDEKLKYLYGNIPEEKWLEEVWFGKLKEVIDRYSPDIIWFDSWLFAIPDEYRYKFCKYYIEQAKKEKKEIVIVRKNSFPLEVSINDLEKSRKDKLSKEVWMTDETLSTGSWCYTENLKIKPSADVLHVLIDIVSKNGVLLLNISPMANGTIPDDQRSVLLDMGSWLDKYGEAIYNTRPWYTYGEGSTKQPEGAFKNRHEFLKLKYKATDIRYTTYKKNIYATILGEPAANSKIVLKAFSKDNASEFEAIKSVSLLGSKAKIEWKLSDEGLEITMPSKMADKMANVFKIKQ